MSTSYNLEPQPTGSAIIHTTLGEISVELFAKQTPLTCRNFLQLALDGYYDDTIFHRLVPGFIVQGGDPTGTGNGGESIYDGGAFSGDLDPWPMDQRLKQNAGPTGINFKDEFHSRLKFDRRGLLAMANESRPNTNGSQFFFTLDKTDELNGKNTMFGRVAGDTIYNLAKIGESEVEDGTERPLYAVKISRIEILVNPFEDMKKRTRVAPVSQVKAPAKKEKKRKGGKQLLSFGDDEGDEETPVLKKTKYDTRIVMADDADEAAPQEKVKKAKKKTIAKTSDEPEVVQDQEEAVESIQKPKAAMKYESSPEPESKPRKKTALERAKEEEAEIKASLRRKVHSQEPAPEKKKSALEALIPEHSTRARSRKKGGNNMATEDLKTLGMLKAFQSRLAEAPPEKETAQLTGEGEVQEEAEGEEGELCDLHFIADCQSCNKWDKQEQEESDDEGWMSHSLSFMADKLGKDLRNRKKGEDELVVIDPREKARTLKEEKRAERDARAGNSGRAWDQGRDQAKNAQMARVASLAGRGAK